MLERAISYLSTAFDICWDTEVTGAIRGFLPDAAPPRLSIALVGFQSFRVHAFGLWLAHIVPGARAFQRATAAALKARLDALEARIK